MKKYVISLLVVLVAIVITSFTTGSIKTSEVKETNEAKKTTVFAHKWWNYHGEGVFDQCDPTLYSPDENNFPDCPITVGLVYCEIYAAPSQWNSDEPDLSTITTCRMRSLF